ncbi:hypothetical protein IE81DRAFT_30882 [Ceraceosorus guamensis]|uniref:Uncharacterized protein n=1 Tax=Ceraceosorus guamensis TaxID=1522189 RepID=A0A316W3I2_9BASI|nr:hypothetical protein IE81DRAFT_30882 [Ceraceosorus guamensis]PWN44350.1 hypothetical protein IE81DRAFT_30882 [Ceraceosorus guamensis]
MSRHATLPAGAVNAQGNSSSQSSPTTHLLISAVSSIPASSLPRLQVELTRASGSRAPSAFKQTEIICTRSDDQARREVEEEDGRWGQTRRARKEVKLRVLCEKGNVTLMLPSPAPPVRKPQAAGQTESPATVRPIVVLDMLLPTSEENDHDDDSASEAGFSEASDDRRQSEADWETAVSSLGWSPEREIRRTGIRFLLREQPLSSGWGASFEVLVYRVSWQS